MSRALSGVLVAAASAFVVALAAWSPTTRAYETDQFHNRLADLRDAAPALDRRVNDALAQICRSWKGPRNERRYVQAVYRTLGGRHWVDRIEKWAMQSPDVDKLRTPRHRSIYANHPVWATRVTAFFGVGVTFKLDGVLIGSDKLGHFFSQGRKFYRRWLRSQDEAHAAAHSAFTERAIFGQFTTGDYSNADLVANYEGHRFYRSLFENGIVAGKPAIVRWEDDGGCTLRRAFAWRDHVNAYWDEALEINHYDRFLYPHMKRRLLSFCADYAVAPARYTIARDVDDALREKYRFLQLRETRELRLPNLCTETRGSP
jgi:hypothetical protein